MHIAYFESINRHEVAITFKKRLKKIIRKYRPKIKKNYWSYEISYPNLMKVYAFFEAIKKNIIRVIK